MVSRVTDAQVRKLMEEMTKHGNQERAAMKADMDRKTARVYIKEGKLPSEKRTERTWRTRKDPLGEDDWAWVEQFLQVTPEVEAKTLFEFLCELKPDRYNPGQLRTFQRRVKMWRAMHGPPREVYFPQQHRPGEAMQTDFTWANVLGVTIQGEALEHKMCHSVLPFSNWEDATVCVSESLMALRKGVQNALFKLGRVPVHHQTDNSTAATHELGDGERGFNKKYLSFMRHFGMEPRTIAVGESHQDGDVESLHNALKNRLKQHLLLRGSRDFESVEDYQRFIEMVLAKANALRTEKIREEMDAMRPLVVSRLPEYSESRVRVSKWSTVRVKFNTYSVPSRLIGEQVRVRIYDDQIEIHYGGQLQLSVDRLLGRGGHLIDYRHVIWSLVNKPGAFERYKYHEAMFPTLVFRRTYDELCASSSSRIANLDYLRILHLAASTMQSEVQAALELLMDTGQVPRFDAVLAMVAPEGPEIPQLDDLEVTLDDYDAHLTEVTS
jgi:hypothetical protein